MIVNPYKDIFNQFPTTLDGSGLENLSPELFDVFRFVLILS